MYVCMGDKKFFFRPAVSKLNFLLRYPVPYRKSEVNAKGFRIWLYNIYIVLHTPFTIYNAHIHSHSLDILGNFFRRAVNGNQTHIHTHTNSFTPKWYDYDCTECIYTVYTATAYTKIISKHRNDRIMNFGSANSMCTTYI